MSRALTKNLDYITRDYAAFKELLIAKLKEKMPEYTDTSETDAGIVILEALANGLDVLSMYIDIVANDVLLPYTQDRGIALTISECLGYTPYNQTSSEYEQVFVLGAVRDRDTIISRGTKVCTTKSSEIATLMFETQADLTIPSGKLGDEKDDKGNYLYHVTIKSGETIGQDVIGSSSGSASQSFVLKYTGVIVDSIQIYVNEGRGFEQWSLVSSFIGHDETEKIYKISVDDYDNCFIMFGDGIHGKIPTEYSNGIVAYYRVGGGEAYNVNQGVINKMGTSVPFVEKTFNLECDVLAHGKEDLESIKVNAPAQFRSRDRLVTLQDYNDLLKINFQEFVDVKTVVDTTTKSLAHIYYMIREDTTFASIQEKVSKFIEEKSMIGTSYDFTEYTKQPVNINGLVYIDTDYNADDILLDVKTYLELVTFKFGNLLFGDYLIKSDVENEIKETFEGIVAIKFDIDDIVSPTAPQNVLTLGTVTLTKKDV